MTVIIVLLITAIVLYEALRGVGTIFGAIAGFINFFTNDNE